MLRGVSRIIGLLFLIGAGSAGIYIYQERFSSQRQIHQLEEQKKVLEQVVERLSDEKRVADVIVTDQKMVDGVPRTTLLFVEYARDGKALPAKSFEIDGDTGHIDALVVKFDRNFVKEGDPLRGHSIALFTRIYGDRQNPANGATVDQPGVIPDVYRGADPRITQFETDLWKDFWKLASDEEFRKEKGVRIANGQGVWGPFEPEKLYTITLESDGGLNITSEPLKGIYKEMLKQKKLS